MQANKYVFTIRFLTQMQFLANLQRFVLGIIFDSRRSSMGAFDLKFVTLSQAYFYGRIIIRSISALRAFENIESRSLSQDP